MRVGEGEFVSLHPLVDLSVDKHVKKAAGFRAAAAELNGETLAVHYQAELANAPSRHDAGKKYFVAYNSRLASERRPGRDDEHLSLALVDYCRREQAGLVLPDDAGSVDFFHAQIPLKSAAEDKARGDADPNKGLGKIDLLGADADGRLVVAKVKYLAPSATRGGTGDTPLRVVLEGLANAAIAAANQAALQEEISERVARTLAAAPPVLMVLGSPRYWELCRKREAQKGAAWIKEMERLAKEIDEAFGVSVMYLACNLQGDPGWSYPEGTPVLDAAPEIARAWEYGAGRVRPKPRPRPKPVDPADVPVEADLSRPIRSYALTESYGSGDRIDHPTLGLGIVQGVAGNGKISVLFGEKKSLLVHERPAGSGSSAPSAPPYPRE
jgi:hypothetical protein